MLAKAPGPMSEEISLDPCPFCGKDLAGFVTCVEMQVCASWRKCEEGQYMCVACSCQNGGCGASTGFFPTAKEAADAWNRRPRIVLDEFSIGKLIEKHTYGPKQP